VPVTRRNDHGDGIVRGPLPRHLVPEVSRTIRPVD
jgi:hypothetical protein